MDPCESRQDARRFREILLELSAFQRRHPEADMYACGGMLSLSQYRYLYALVARYVHPEWKVLDWGCGHGHFSFFLLKSGFQAWAYSIDGKPALLTEAEGRFPGRIEYSAGSLHDPVRLPYADGHFDAVFSIGVLEHVRETGGDERKSLREIRRILRGGGLFIAYHFPNRTSLIEFLGRLVGHPRTHPYRFSPEDIRSICRDAGLDLIELKTYSFLPRNFLRRLPPVLRDSSGLARLFNLLDAAIERLLPALCQNHLFVARRPTG